LHGHLASINGYTKWLSRPKGKVHTFKVDTTRVKEIINKTVKGNEGAVVGDEALEILSAYGIQVAGVSLCQ